MAPITHPLLSLIRLNPVQVRQQAPCSRNGDRQRRKTGQGPSPRGGGWNPAVSQSKSNFSKIRQNVRRKAVETKLSLSSHQEALIFRNILTKPSTQRTETETPAPHPTPCPSLQEKQTAQAERHKEVPTESEITNGLWELEYMVKGEESNTAG